jgi:ABC-type sugar transport system ATPase subunit
MNFFDGSIRRGSDGLYFEEGTLENARIDSGDGPLRSDEPVVKVGELTMPGNGFRIPIPRHLTEVLAGKVDQHVVLGIRPEHFSLHPIEGDPTGTSIKVTLNVTEPLGSAMDIYMKTALHDHVVGRVEAEAGLVMGSQVDVYIDLRKVHYFEPGATGMNLSVTKEPTHAIA